MTSNDQGVFYSRQTIKDSVSGIPVLDVIIPEGWTATCEVSWNNVSTIFPGVAQVTLLSPDKKAGIVWCSGRNYLELTGGPFVFHQDGIDLKTYTTKLQYRRADAMTDFWLGQIFGLQMFAFVKEFDPPEPAQQGINRQLQLYADSLNQKLTPVFASGGARYIQNGREATLANLNIKSLCPMVDVITRKRSVPHLVSVNRFKAVPAQSV